MKRKTDNKKKGRSGEDIAVKMLEEKGFKIIERNFQYRQGEIDIIATKGHIIAFVEVKARYNDLYGYPVEAVTPSKRKKIIQTSEVFLSSKDYLGMQARYDIIEVDYSNSRVNHIENAFWA